MPNSTVQAAAVFDAPTRGQGDGRLTHGACAPRTCPLPRWRLQRVQALVEARIAEPLSLAEMAAAAGLSRMHFAAQFRAATGLRPHAYLLTRRVQRAMAQMLAEDTPLAQLALAVGFQSQSHFSTVFKRITGKSPAAWRNAARSPRRSPGGAVPRVRARPVPGAP